MFLKVFAAEVYLYGFAMKKTVLLAAAENVHTPESVKFGNRTSTDLAGQCYLISYPTQICKLASKLSLSF